MLARLSSRSTSFVSLGVYAGSLRRKIVASRPGGNCVAPLVPDESVGLVIRTISELALADGVSETTGCYALVFEGG